MQKPLSASITHILMQGELILMVSFKSYLYSTFRITQSRAHRRPVESGGTWPHQDGLPAMEGPLRADASPPSKMLYHASLSNGPSYNARF